MTYRVKDVKRMYRFVGYEEQQLQEYDYGLVTPRFCLLWKDGEKINKKIIKELLKMKDEVEKEDKKINSPQKNAIRCVKGEIPTPGDKHKIKYSTSMQKEKVNGK
jgi:hypothetical protein